MTLNLKFNFNTSLLEHYSINTDNSGNIIQTIDNTYIPDKESVITRFRVEAVDSKFYKLTGDNIRISTEDTILIASILGYKDTDSFNSITMAKDYADCITSAYESFSGASNYINDILHNRNTQYCDKEISHVSLIEAVLMLLGYPRKHNTQRYNGYLFRGEQLDIKEYVCNTYMSTSCSIQVAHDFTPNEGRILAIKKPEIGYLMNLYDIAVCYNNGDMLDEYEILLCTGATVKVGRRLGIYKETPVYETNIDYSNMELYSTINRICNQFIATYSTDLIFGIAELLNNIKYIDDFGNLYDSAIEIRLKNGEIVNIDTSTDKFIINGISVPRKFIPLKIKGMLRKE